MKGAAYGSVLCLYAAVPWWKPVHGDDQRRGAADGHALQRQGPPEALAALWRCGDKVTASRLEYAIKAKLTHGQKETLAAAPGRIGEWFPALPAEVVTTLPAGKEFPIFANQT